MKNPFLLFALIVLIAILALNSRALNGYFVGDDFDKINAIQDKGPRFFLRLFASDYYSAHTKWREHEYMKRLYYSTGPTGLIRPLTMISFKLQYLFQGTHPTGYHLVNAIFHFLNCLLVFLIINRVTRHEDHLFGFFSGLFFAVNPIVYHAVGWISNRAEIMAGFFCLLSFYLFLLYDSKHKKRHYVLSVLALLFALFTKESALVLPPLLISYDLLRDFKLEFSDLRLKTNFFILIKNRLPIWLPYLVVTAFYFTDRKIALGTFLGAYGEPLIIDIGRKISNLLSYVRYTVFARPYDQNVVNLMILPERVQLETLLRLVSVLIPLFILGANRLNWRLLCFSVLWLVVSYIPIFLYPSAVPWIFYLPVVGVSAMLVTILFALPWKRISRLACLALLIFYGTHQFKYSSNFGSAGSIAKQTIEEVEHASRNFRQGDTLVLIDIPEFYNTAFVFPLDSHVESALEKPFTSIDLTKRFAIKRFNFFHAAFADHSKLDAKKLSSLKGQGQDRVHIFIWDEARSRVEGTDFSKFVASSGLLTTSEIPSRSNIP